MNIQKWLTPLLLLGRKKRSSGRGMMWASILSVLVSFIALRGLKKGQIDIPKNPLKSLNIPNKVTDIQQFLNPNDRKVLAEISDEFTPSNLLVEHNQSNHTNVEHNHEI
ncbi:hypothetical protein [Pseudoneobacillus sp. C159]